MSRKLINAQDFFILVVDDIPLNLKILRAILEPIGYPVTFASSGQQALERIAIAKPDIILLDLMMPEMDGLEVCKILKTDPNYTEIPVIFLTASQEKEHLLQAFENGAVDYVVKPFNKLELLARINTHLTLKHYQDCLQKQAELERVRTRITQSIRSSLYLDHILQNTVWEICQFLQADRVIIFHFTDIAQGRILAQSSVFTSEIIDKTEPKNLTWLHKIFHSSESQKIHIIDNIHTSIIYHDHLAYLKLENVKSELVIPIYQQNYLWGTLVAHHCQNYHHWLEDEIKLLSELTEQIEVAIQQSELYNQLNKAYQELQLLAHVDSLTQVANRRQFDQYIAQEWLRLKREKQVLSLILCDVDYFKLYNDYYGHPSGDTCLYKVAQILTANIKRPADLVTRYGGEEFAIILPNTSAQGAQQVAQNIQQALAEINIPHAQSLVKDHVTLSMGIASMIPHPDFTSDDLIKAADQALYAAKRNGRNQYFVYN